MDDTIILLLIILIVLVLGVFVYLVYTKQTAKNQKDVNNLTPQDLVTVNQKQGEIAALVGQLNTSLQQQAERNIKSLGDYQFEVIKNLESKLKEMNEYIGKKLDDNIEKANTAYTNISERVLRIDQTKEQMETLNRSVLSLNNVLQDRQSRGIFGEVQLYYLLENAFGETSEIFEKQFTMENGNIVDAIIKAPDPVGMIPVDSKFPLDNYRVSVDLEADETLKREATKKFKVDVRKHIDDISKKYVTKETHPYAIMFIPAEAIFTEINNNHQDLIAYAHKNNVWITSPTTLVYILSMISSMIIHNEKTENIKEILDDIEKLTAEFKRLENRWDTYYKTVNRSIEQGSDLDITFRKINRLFNNVLDRKIIDEDLEEEE